MTTLSTFDAAATAKLLDFAALLDALRTATLEHDAGTIHSPVRTSVPLTDGGVVLSMPASAHDIAIHKLVSVAPANVRRNMPTIFGTVTVCDGTTGEPQFILDGPTVTGRRTAALSMLGIRLLRVSPPRAILIIGTGQQARFHALAIRALHPSAKLFVKGGSVENESSFIERMALEGVSVSPTAGKVPAEAEVVITVTTSKTPVYAEDAREGRLVIGVGAFTPDAAEIGPKTVRGSLVYVDDLKAAHAEAGDLLQAGIDWSAVRPLSAAVALGVPHDRPVMLKTVGSGAWDLAACRVARAALG